MGAPKKQRKKYSTPSHPWQKERILSEKELLDSYGLRRKSEIWKMNSILKNFSKQAKSLITKKIGDVETERSQLLKKLNALGLLEKDTKIADVLSITLNDLMGRRLQTLVHKKNLSKSVNQARQFITHRHIMVGNKRITTPSYLVLVEEENSIQFVPNSNLSDPNHAERIIDEKKSRKNKKEALEVKEKKKEEKAITETNKNKKSKKSEKPKEDAKEVLKEKETPKKEAKKTKAPEKK